MGAGGEMGWCVIIDSCLWSCAMIRVLCGNYYSLGTTTLSKILAISRILGLAGGRVLYGNYYTLRTTALSNINAISSILGFGGGLLWMLVVGCFASLH